METKYRYLSMGQKYKVEGDPMVYVRLCEDEELTDAELDATVIALDD